MPFRPCCSRVGRLLDPDLCCSCVGRSSPVSRRACTPDPALSHRHARPPAAVNAGHFSPDADSRPKTGSAATRGLPASRYPPARPGMTHRDGQSMRRRIKSTHIMMLLCVVKGPSRVRVSSGDGRHDWSLSLASGDGARARAAGLRTRQGRGRSVWSVQALIRSRGQQGGGGAGDARPAGRGGAGDGRRIIGRPARMRQPHRGPGRPRGLGVSLRGAGGGRPRGRRNASGSG